MIREGILLSCYGLFLVSTSTNSIHRRTNHTPSSPAIARLPKLHRAILSGLAFPQDRFSNTIPTNPSRLSMEVCFASTPFSIQALWLPLCVFGSARRTFRLPEARESIRNARHRIQRFFQYGCQQFLWRPNEWFESFQKFRRPRSNRAKTSRGSSRHHHYRGSG